MTAPTAAPSADAPTALAAASPRPALRLVDADHPVDELGARIVALSGRLAAATCRWLLLVAEFDAAEGYRRFGLISTGRWLGHACGLSDRTATDHVRVARALAAHPRLAEEMSAGRLSYSHVRAISRVARPDEPDLVEGLINAAEHGTVRQLEAMVRGLRTARDNAETDVIPDESVTFGWTQAGQWRLSARVDPERGALVARALRELARAQDITQTEALIRLAEIGLATLADDADAPRPLRGDERAAVVIHLDESRIPASNGSREPSAGTRPYARIEDGPGLPAPVIERLLCSARIRTAVGSGPMPYDEILALGRSRRLVNDRQFRALLLRHDGHCAHPGCRNRARLDAHHVLAWLRGGATDLSNLVLLCEPHHLALHEGEFSMAPTSRRGRFRFVRADGLELIDHADPEAAGATADPVEREHPEVSAEAARSGWRGERLDHGYAVGTLAQHLRPA